MKESILGEEAPFMQRIDNSSHFAYLYNAVLTKCEPQVRDIIHEDEIAARREVVNRGGFYEIEYLVYIYKYASTGDKTFYDNLINNLYKREVYFKLHGEAGYIKIIGTSTNARFYVQDAIIRPLKTNDTRDVMTVRLISLDEVKLPTI